MEYRSLYAFYWFGTCLRYLQDANSAYLINGDGKVLFNAVRLFKLLDMLGLHVTKKLAHSKLDELLAQLEERKEESAKLTNDEANDLRERIQAIRDTLEAEITGVGAYSPTPKRLDLGKLTDSIGDLFAPGVFDLMPSLSKFDFQEAGKCIAFERSTAGAFHILRGTEGVLRNYYRCMVRTKRIKSTMWGPIVEDLRKRSTTKSYVALNSHLDHIRASFRNPTQHPEAVYDIHEVQDLLSLCIEVINRMTGTARKAGRM